MQKKAAEQPATRITLGWLESPVRIGKRSVGRSDDPYQAHTAEGDPLEFDVVVREGASETRHQVTISREMQERLAAGKHTAELCIEAAFRFLLDREPKGGNPQALRCGSDLALLSRIRTRAAALSLRAGGELRDYRMIPEGHFRAASTAWASARPAMRDCAIM
jgi:hypothetical protein